MPDPAIGVIGLDSDLDPSPERVVGMPAEHPPVASP